MALTSTNERPRLRLKTFFNVILSRRHVCPWWLCFTFDNVFRKAFQDPHKILKGLIRAGDTVLDIGAGMGYFTIPMAKLAGPTGRVIAVDIQEHMLAGVRKRSEKAGLQERIALHLASADSLDLRTPADFILTFWMLHEVPDRARFLDELSALLKEKGSWLLAEPRMHVSMRVFEEIEAAAVKAGFSIARRPEVPMSRAALFVKAQKPGI